MIKTTPSAGVAYGLRPATIIDGDRSLLGHSRTMSPTRWWNEHQGRIPDGYLQLIALEADATHVVHFHPAFVPGLLQTREYADAISLSTHVTPVPHDFSERLVDVRMQRQRELFDPANPVDATFILDESAILRPVGSAAVMRRQLNHLSEVLDRPRVTLILLPLDGPPHAGLGAGGFMLLTTAGNKTLFFEGPTGNFWYDLRTRPELVDQFSGLAERLVQRGSNRLTTDILQSALTGDGLT
jgi:hypothetical protein